MKIYILLAIQCLAPFVVMAQNSENEAMAAYMLAEESYASGDYASALRFLAKAEQNLGKSNSKLLYLKIQVQSELYKTDNSYYDKIMETINEFQSGSDIYSFKQEKVIDVVKIKMAMENQRDEQIKTANKIQEEQNRIETNYRNFAFEGWPFGVTLESLKITHADSHIFFKNRKLKKQLHEFDKTLTVICPRSITTGYGKFAVVTCYPRSILDEGENIFAVIMRDDKVIGYRKTIYLRQNYYSIYPNYHRNYEWRTRVASGVDQNEKKNTFQKFTNLLGKPTQKESICRVVQSWESGNTKIILWAPVDEYIFTMYLDIIQM